MFLQYVLLQMKRSLLTREIFLQLKSAGTCRRQCSTLRRVTRSLLTCCIYANYFCFQTSIHTETLAPVSTIQGVKFLSKQTAKSAMNHLKYYRLHQNWHGQKTGGFHGPSIIAVSPLPLNSTLLNPEWPHQSPQPPPPLLIKSTKDLRSF